MIRAPSFRALGAWPHGPLHLLKPGRRRLLSTNPSPPDPEAAQKARSRAHRIFARLPKFLQRYTTPLINAPTTHIASFLLLHEITAIAPLVVLAGIFHYTHWLPPYISEGRYVSDGIEKFGNYFRRKGWLGEDERTKRHRWWGKGEGGVRVVVEVATAYAITKALLPLRLIFSVAATPLFARVAVIPTMNFFKKFLPSSSTLRRMFRRGGKKGASSAGAGTGAVGGGAIPKGPDV